MKTRTYKWIILIFLALNTYGAPVPEFPSVIYSFQVTVGLEGYENFGVKMDPFEYKVEIGRNRIQFAFFKMAKLYDGHYYFDHPKADLLCFVIATDLSDRETWQVLEYLTMYDGYTMDCEVSISDINTEIIFQ